MKLLKLTESFLEKSDRVNDPLELLSETEQYDSFMLSLGSGIYKQALWVSKQLPSLDFLTDDIRPMTSDEQQALQRWLENNMPKLSTYVNEDKVYKYYKYSFEWGVNALYSKWAMNPKFRAIGFTKAKKNPLDGLSEAELNRQYQEAMTNNAFRPQHQIDLEDAINHQDYKGVKQIIDKIPDDDPYKATMQSMFADAYSKGEAIIAQEAAAGGKFVLTDKFYIGSLKNQANYLLNKSSLDETTRNRIITIIRDGKLNNLTIDEVSTLLSDEFEEISASRAFMIARTETCQAMSSGQMAAMRESGVPTKEWVVAGGHTCALCEDNAAQGMIPIADTFDSGDDAPPGHPNCECYIEAGEIDLSAVSIWDGE